MNPANKGHFAKISPERAFADFIFAHLVLHLTVINFIGWALKQTTACHISKIKQEKQ